MCLGATGHLAAGAGHVGAVGATSGLTGLWALGLSGAFGTGGCASLERVGGCGVSRCCRCGQTHQNKHHDLNLPHHYRNSLCFIKLGSTILISLTSSNGS